MRDGLMGAELQFHPAASVFPMMRGEEYQELLYDIQEHGLREPILLCDGQILDGRNRFRVCREIGIEPAFRKWDGKGGSPLSVVLSLNLHRRHLTSSQRAAIAVEILPMLEREAKERQRESGREHGRGKVVQKTSQPIDGPMRQPRSTEQAARLLSTNSDYVKAAKKVHEADPALLQKVRDGETHIADALRRVVKDKKQQLPTAKEAKRIAIAENKMVPARDGYYHSPKPEEQIAQEVEQGQREGTFFHAIEDLNSMPVEPEQLASEISDYRRFRVENHLEGAFDYLKRFKEIWR